MKRVVIASLLYCALPALWSCKNDTSEPPPPAAPATQQESTGTQPGLAPAPAGTEPGADCNHPGAGKPIGNDRCECTTSHNISGDWSTLRTCLEGGACTTRDQAETLTITQDGTNVRATRGDSYTITGTICGDVVVWEGGASDGLNDECGTIRLLDDGHFIDDWCFATSGACKRSSSCAGQKGECTGTGARAPAKAAAIQKPICD